MDLGDKRRTARLLKLCGQLAAMPESSINQACGEWAETKAASRFFHNDHVDEQPIRAAHRAKPVARAGQHRTVLAIQDTSYLVYTSQGQTTGLGPLSVTKGKCVEKSHSHGLVRQSGVAVTTAGVPLGLLAQQIFAREEVPEGQSTQRNVLPIEEKESSRWREALKNSRQLMGDTHALSR